MDEKKNENGQIDLSSDQNLVTVRAIMNNLEGDIQAIVRGDIDEKTARLVVAARRAQLNGASLHIAAARLHVAMRKEVPGWLGAKKPEQG